jgi:hypothetical protein
MVKVNGWRILMKLQIEYFFLYTNLIIFYSTEMSSIQIGLAVHFYRSFKKRLLLRHPV